MKITKRDRVPECPFDILKPGAVFTWDNEVYMRIEVMKGVSMGPVNAVRIGLEVGELTYFERNAKVRFHADAELVI